MRLCDPPRWPATASRCLLLATAVLIAVYAGGPVTTNDLFWHVKTGQHLWDVGGFPDRDVFSYTTAHLDWVLHEWLTQVGFAGLYELGGFRLLRAFTAGMALWILYLVYRLAHWHLRDAIWVAPVVLAFALLGVYRLQTRPTLFSMALMLLQITWLVRRRGDWRIRDGAVLVGLVLLWVNLHSVGLLALILYATYLLGLAGRAWLRRDGAPSGRDVRRHAATMAAAIGAACVTPSGWHLFGFAFQDKNVVMNFIIDEWGAFSLDYARNPDLPLGSYVVVLMILATVLGTCLLTGFALDGVRTRRTSPFVSDPVQLAMLGTCLVGGLAARRFQWLLALALLFAMTQVRTLFVHGALPKIAECGRHAVTRAGIAIFTLLGLGVLYAEDLRFENRCLHATALSSAYYTDPIAPSLDLPGVRFMRAAGLTGNAYCHYASGGILSWFLHPRIKVFIDSRVDLYRRAVFLDFLAVRDGRPDQQKILDAHGTDIYYRHWEIRPLREPQLWTRVYAGPDGDIWLRNHPRNAANLARCRALGARSAATPR